MSTVRACQGLPFKEEKMVLKVVDGKIEKITKNLIETDKLFIYFTVSTEDKEYCKNFEVYTSESVKSTIKNDITIDKIEEFNGVFTPILYMTNENIEYYKRKSSVVHTELITIKELEEILERLNKENYTNFYRKIPIDDSTYLRNALYSLESEKLVETTAYIEIREGHLLSNGNCLGKNFMPKILAKLSKNKNVTTPAISNGRIFFSYTFTAAELNKTLNYDFKKDIHDSKGPAEIKNKIDKLLE